MSQNADWQRGDVRSAKFHVYEGLELALVVGKGDV